MAIAVGSGSGVQRYLAIVLERMSELRRVATLATTVSTFWPPL
jgi:hypothetical protein